MQRSLFVLGLLVRRSLGRILGRSRASSFALQRIAKAPMRAEVVFTSCTGLKYCTIAALVSFDEELMSHITRKKAIIAVMKSAKASFHTPP